MGIVYLNGSRLRRSLLAAADWVEAGREELNRILLNSFDKIWKIAEEKKVSLRTAAYLLGIGRVGRATVLGGF